MKSDFKNKSVLITGAAMGIGRAIALAAAEYGANLVLGDIAESELAATAQDARKLGANVVFQHCDVTNSAAVIALAKSAGDNFGDPSLVFANAGILGAACLPWDCSETEVARVLDLNFMGVWRTMTATMPAMIARNAGAFVATASAAGLVGAEGLAPYVASKHAIIGLVKSVALSAAPQGVRVNALCPGMTATPLLDQLTGDNPGMREALMANNPMKRLAESEEIAAAALWLASSKSSFVTGHALSVDGGYVAA